MASLYTFQKYFKKVVKKFLVHTPPKRNLNGLFSFHYTTTRSNGYKLYKHFSHLNCRKPPPLHQLVDWGCEAGHDVGFKLCNFFQFISCLGGNPAILTRLRLMLAFPKQIILQSHCQIHVTPVSGQGLQTKTTVCYIELFNLNRTIINNYNQI